MGLEKCRDDGGARGGVEHLWQSSQRVSRKRDRRGMEEWSRPQKEMGLSRYARSPIDGGPLD